MPDEVWVDLIAVGTELLLGQVEDTNSGYIARQLSRRGFFCRRQTTVGDNEGRISAALASSLRHSDAVILYGGLGPTQDDITRFAVAKCLEDQLVVDGQSLEAIRTRFARRKLEMPARNECQALYPSRGRAIVPDIGTACGFVCDALWPPGRLEAEDGAGRSSEGEAGSDGASDARAKVVYVLPGVPDEMKEMLHRAVLPDLNGRFNTGGRVLCSWFIRTFGVSESMLADLIGDRVEALESERGPNRVTVAYLAGGADGVRIRLTATGTHPTDVEASLRSEAAEMVARLGQCVFALDRDESRPASLAQVLADALLASGLSLAVAESVTGGLVSAALVGVPGASRWFRGSLVAYQDDVKATWLGLTPGQVVSEQAAAQLAEGAKDRFGAQVGLGITGVAGPSEQEGQPIGTVYLAVSGPGGRTVTEAKVLAGHRTYIRQMAASHLLDLARRMLAPPLHLC